MLWRKKSLTTLKLTMPRYEQHVNAKVGREQAEILQQKLFAAATSALDTAMNEGAVSGSLLSACQSILRDSGLSPDLTPDEDVTEVASNEMTSKWIDCLEDDLGLN